ncbi:hypothetical protein [Spirulina sp. 06S082]|uniref:hypothetical protein n=1 Tax=Spirulina sp. 06S082 TaxID=3110248 RepID=UPI002B1EC9E4|nr:hypothetical protein [Spirulina sp. 06S082]MEA5468262.1 hypothetical protein [Spirulina sp. 06S082]
MKKISIHIPSIRWTTLGTLQLVSAVVVIPISFFLAVQEGVKFLLGATIQLSGDFSPESSAMAIFITLVIATIALIASSTSIFISLAMFREKEWTLLGTTIVQGCILGTEITKFFLYVKPNFIGLFGAIVIVTLCLLKLKERAYLNKQKEVSVEPIPDPLQETVQVHSEK